MTMTIPSMKLWPGIVMRVVTWFFSGVANLVCPPNCLACFEPLDRDDLSHFFCGECCRKMIVVASECCPSCGSIGRMMPPPGESPQVHTGCGECVHQKFRFSRTVVLGHYADSLRSLILDMKSDRDGILSTNMAKLLLKTRELELRDLVPELIVPVPMHFVRRLFRGTNNPVFFAKEIGHALGIPVGVCVIKRTRYTKPQFHLKPRQRYRNVRGAFAFVGRKKAVAGKHVLIVDDVMTTGATCNEVARVLCEAGAASVSVAVFARAMGKYNPLDPTEKPIDA